jgi:hypothetical protein
MPLLPHKDRLGLDSLQVVPANPAIQRQNAGLVCAPLTHQPLEIGENNWILQCLQHLHSINEVSCQDTSDSKSAP